MLALAFAAAMLINRAPCSVPPQSGFVCERLTYQSDGLPVIAYLYRAREAPANAPLILFNRGSYIVKDQAPILLPMLQRLAAEGFVVLAPMYRGSEGAPGHDEVGGADLNDLKNALPLATELGFATPNVFLYGESRGGVMVLLALRDQLPVRAAATWGAFTDMKAYVDADPRVQTLLPTIWSDYAKHGEELLRQRSAIAWADRIHVPLLLMHGGADAQVSPDHTLNLAKRLQQAGATYSLIVFAGDTHTLPGNQVERDRQAVLWFRAHMK